MRKFYFLIILVVFAMPYIAYSQIISTIAGNGYNAEIRFGGGGFSGDGGPATTAELFYPAGIAVDNYGNVYIADQANGRIRMVSTSGIISTIAGSASQGYSGDGGPATAAELADPTGVAVDVSGNVYIADWQNSRIRKVNSSGIISTFAGTGNQSYWGNGVAATVADIEWPEGIAADAAGNVYITDYQDNHIRMINTSGIITTIGGIGSGGFSGDGGYATAAEIYRPNSITVDLYGNIYFTDNFNQRVRKINSSGIISTVAGCHNSGSFSGDGGPATLAELNSPSGIRIDIYGNIYITDSQNNRIRMINAAGIINTISGYQSYGFAGDGGPATAAEFDYPIGLAIDAAGNIYIGDAGNNRIREITSTITPLPITLISFTATYFEQSNSVLVDWDVATQLNNKEFLVQKTVDGTNYENVATVAGAGTTPFPMTYSAVDTHPAHGISYYRLEQIDDDDNTTDFPPEPVFTGNYQSPSVNLYPDPVNSIATLIYISTDNNPLSIDIIDMTGRKAGSYMLNKVLIGENNFTMNMASLSRGIYFLQATEALKNYTLKFVKE